jgi:hypothetical protein
MSIHPFLTNLEDEISIKEGRICKTQIYDSVLRIVETFGKLLRPFSFHDQLILLD